MEETPHQQQSIDQQKQHQPIIKDGRTNSILEYNLLYKNTSPSSKTVAVPPLINSDILLLPPTKGNNERIGWQQTGVDPCFVQPYRINDALMEKIDNLHRKMLGRIAPVRMRPYFIPERSRTKSENNDTTTSLFNETATIVNSMNEKLLISQSMMDTCDNNNIYSAMETNQQLNSTNLCGNNMNNSSTINKHRIETNTLKKCKSLEDVRAENLDGSQPSHEMEFVSSRIQKLKVTE